MEVEAGNVYLVTFSWFIFIPYETNATHCVSRPATHYNSKTIFLYCPFQDAFKIFNMQITRLVIGTPSIVSGYANNE